MEISEGIEFPNGVNLKVLTALFVTWMLAFLSLLKGISSLGKISYFTAIFPYVMITALIIRGVTLPGAMKGLEFYILHVDMKKLLTLKVNNKKITLIKLKLCQHYLIDGIKLFRHGLLLAHR